MQLIHVFSLASLVFLTANILRTCFWRSCSPRPTCWVMVMDGSMTQSKQWNKHYSFLFSAAGLPCALFQHEYNVHFLCTSNLAALLGDNPMQSEFACHVGPGGKLLCCICDVKGVDGLTNESQLTTVLTSTDGANGGHTTPDSIGTSDGNGNSSANDSHTPANGCKRKLESMQEMVVHVTHFVETGTSQTRDGTLQELHSIIADAGIVGNISKVWAHKTSTGIEDAFLETYLDWIHTSYKSQSSWHDKQVALDTFKSMLPANMKMLSPMWQIWGMSKYDLSLACL